MEYLKKILPKIHAKWRIYALYYAVLSIAGGWRSNALTLFRRKRYRRCAATYPPVEDYEMASKQAEQLFDFDISKYMSDFKLPGLDVETLVGSQRKNIEALTQANKLAYEGLQAVLKRQVEILRQTMDEVAVVSKDIAEPGTPQDKAAKQAELAKEAFERSLSNMRELAEMIAKANNEAFELLNKRFTQNLDEMRDVFVKASKK